MGASGSAGGHLLPHTKSAVSKLCALLFHSCPISLISLPSHSVPATTAADWWFPALPYLCSREQAVVQACLYFGTMCRELSHSSVRCFAKAGKKGNPCPEGSAGTNNHEDEEYN